MAIPFFHILLLYQRDGTQHECTFNLGSTTYATSSLDKNSLEIQQRVLQTNIGHYDGNQMCTKLGHYLHESIWREILTNSQTCTACLVEIYRWHLHDMASYTGGVVLLHWCLKQRPQFDKIHGRHKRNSDKFPRRNHLQRPERKHYHRPIHKTNGRLYVSTLFILPPTTPEDQHTLQSSHSFKKDLQHKQTISASYKPTWEKPNQQRLPKTINRIINTKSINNG